VGAVLSAVFIPCAFISGITGLFFRQFALTIAASTLISAVNSLTLSPALTAVLLKSHRKDHRQPLPRLAVAVLGGGLGLRLLATKVAVALSSLAAPSLLVSLSPCLLVLLGAAAGWLVGPTLNRVLDWLFRMFDAAFRSATNVYTRLVGMLLRVSFLVLVVY